MFIRPPSTLGPLFHPQPPKGILVSAAETGSYGGSKSLELLHQSNEHSSVPHVLGKPNQRQTLNSSCSRPIKTLLQCRLPLLKSDILVINKSKGWGKLLLLLISFSSFKKSSLLEQDACPRNLSTELCPLPPCILLSRILTPGLLQARVGPGFSNTAWLSSKAGQRGLLPGEVATS